MTWTCSINISETLDGKTVSETFYSRGRNDDMLLLLLLLIFLFCQSCKVLARPFIGTFFQKDVGYMCVHAKNNLCLNVKMITCMHGSSNTYVLVKDGKKMVAIRYHQSFHILTFMLHIHTCYIRQVSCRKCIGM